MKIAVTSTGTDLQSAMDPRFGRARYILIVDTETKEVEVMDNEKNVQSFKGAGIQAATAVADMGAEVLLTGYCGPNAFKTLNAGGIKVVQDVAGTVQGAVVKFTEGNLAYSEAPNKDGHW
jgi:predicted Fe-Mo cluster-binding NifX family protein